MIESIISFSVHRRGIVFVFALLAIIAGIYAFKDLPIDAVPDITNVQVQIATPAKGLTPEEIERQVTFPLEIALNGIMGVEQVRSVTRFGLSHITVTFNEDMNVIVARQLIGERLAMAKENLPPNVHPQMGPITTGLGEIFHYVLKPKVYKTGEEGIKQLMDLKALQDWEIKPRLMRVKGIAEVNTIGGHEKQYHVRPNLMAIKQYGLSLWDLQLALSENNYNTGGGYVEKGDVQVLLLGSGLLKTIKDIENVPIKTTKSLKPLKVKDVATVALDTALRTGAGTVNGHEAIIGSPMMLIGENSRTVSKRVEAEIKEIQKNLPPEVELNILYNRSELVDHTLGTVEHNLLMGCGLVVLFLLLLVGNVRAAIVTSFTIPICLLMTFIVMRIAGVSGNLMSLGALDFGIIIDGAVIVVDHCVRLVQKARADKGQKLTRLEVSNVVIKATSEIRQAAGFGELIILVVFLPLFALIGVEGKMFRPMASTFIMALGSALILSFTVTPALAATFLSGDIKDSKPFLMRIFEKIYAPSLSWAIKARFPTMGLSFALLIVSLFLFSRLGGEFMPRLDEGSLAIQVMRENNVAPSTSVRQQEETEKALLEFPEVSHVFSRIGTPEVANDPMGINLADTYIMLKPKEEWPNKNLLKTQLAENILKSLNAKLPHQAHLVSQPIEMRFNELLEGTRTDIALKIYGEDIKTLQELGHKIQNIVEKIPGAADVEMESEGTLNMIEMSVKTEMQNELAFGSDHLLAPLSMGFAGLQVGTIYEGVKRFPLVIRLSHHDRQDLNELKNFPINLHNELNIPLSKLANIREVETWSAIYRENAQRRTAVLINVRGRDIESFVHEGQAAIEKAIKIPAGYFIKWGGNFENLQEAKERLKILVPMTLLIVLLMIYSAFHKLGQTFLIFGCIPFAWVGGILSLVIAGLPFSISAAVGFVALSGIAVLNGVVLVSYFNHLKLEGKSGVEMVKEGAMLRLRPVVMTALTDIFGFLPMVLSHGMGAEVQRPLACVVIGGVISSTLLTLLLLPVIFQTFEKYLGVSTTAKAH